MATEYKKANVHILSPQYDISVLGGLKNTHRILLKYIHANYLTDQDLQVVLFYKKLYSNVEESIPFTMSKDNEYFKQKLPVAILVREWRLELHGFDLETFELLELGTNWIAHPIGGR